MLDTANVYLPSMRLLTIDSHGTSSHDMSSPDSPPADLHSKHNIESPPYSRTHVLNKVHNGFSSTRRLQQVLGIQDPEPLIGPPEMPQKLEQKFMEGLREFGINLQITDGSSLEALSQAASMRKKVAVDVNLDKTQLEGIKEETKSPIRAKHEADGPEAIPVGLTITTSAWGLGDEAAARRRVTLDNSEQHLSIHGGANDSFGQQTAAYTAKQPCILYSHGASDTNHEEDRTTYSSYARFDSTTFPAKSQISQPASSSVTDTKIESIQPDIKAHAPRIASFAHVDCGIDYGCVGANYAPPQPSISLGSLSHHRFRLSGEKRLEVYPNHLQALGSHKASKCARSAPVVLFPSPRVGHEQPWNSVQSKPDGTASIVSGIGTHAFDLTGANISLPVDFVRRPQDSSAIPQIKVQAPSPKKLPTSKKRAIISQNQRGSPAAKARSADTTAGLPILAAEEELLWKIKFPGNTYALLTIMLPWSLSMQRLYKQVRDPHLFSINPAFPYSVTPPIHQQLLSVAFYNDSVTPHKEIRFIGPGDVAQISYNEVDTFTYSKNVELHSKQAEHACKVAAMKGVLRLNAKHQQANTGEGRWAYILLQGHSKSQETPPHMIIAWRISGITSTSSCLHTIYPDGNMVSKSNSRLINKTPKRFGSLQNLAARLHDPAGMHRELRSASSSELPSENKVRQEGALTLKREVWEFEKAGRVPLIEGYRVDVQRWKGWLSAVGKGKGKVIVWKEQE